jgi:hypothetical protein
MPSIVAIISLHNHFVFHNSQYFEDFQSGIDFHKSPKCLPQKLDKILPTLTPDVNSGHEALSHAATCLA